MLFGAGMEEVMSSRTEAAFLLQIKLKFSVRNLE